MIFVFYVTCLLCWVCVVRLNISCSLWYDVMHILYVSRDIFDVLLCSILGLLVSGWEIPCHPNCIMGLARLPFCAKEYISVVSVYIN